MSDRPRIFISTVTSELRSTRQRVADILRRKGFEPECQDIFGTEHGDLRDMLRRKIEGCAGLIQIIGDAYGAEPADPATGEPLPDAQFGRCSYTQYEFLLARSLGKKTWLLIAGGTCARDTAPALLDLPRDSAHPDPAAWQAERRQLQRDYRQRPEVRQHLYYTAASDLALDLQVERMDDKLEELRKDFRRWQRTVLRLAAAVILLTGIVLGTQWWMKREADKGTGKIIAGQKEIAEGQKAIIEGPKITTAGIRKQILLGSEKKRDRDLAEAEAAEPAKREKLREAALDAHKSRISRIDELAQSFTELEGRADTTAVFKEMARVLEQEGVDLALAYIAEQKGGILDRVRKRKETEQAQTRTELQPLLTAARLKASSGQTVAARAAYRELLALDPAWPAALESTAWFLYDQSIQNVYHGTLVAAIADAEESHTLSTRLHTAAPANFSANQMLIFAKKNMGDVLIKRGQNGDAAKVQDHYIRSLELAEALLKANPGSAEATQGVSISLNSLGDFLAQRGQTGDADKALGYFTRSLEMAEALLKTDPGSGNAKRDVSFSLRKVGYFLSGRGQTGDADKALGYLTRCNEVLEALLKAYPDEPEAKRDVAVSLDSLGDFLVTRGQVGDADKALGYFTRSLDMKEALLKAYPGAPVAARDVSINLGKLGGLLVMRGQAGDADKALGYLTRCNDLLEALLKANPGSAQATRDVSMSLEELGAFLATRGQVGDADKALGYFTRNLDMRETLLKAYPGSALATRDVVAALLRLADLANDRNDSKDETRHHRAIYDLLKPAIERGMTFDPPIVQLYEELKAEFAK